MNLKTASATKLLGGLALLLVAALGWFLLVGPTVGRLGDVGERRTAAEDRSSSMSLQLSTLRRQAEDLPETRREADQIALALPPTADQPGFFKAVTDAASAAGIRAESITDITQGAPQLIGEEDDPAAAESDLVVPEAVRGAKVALQLVTVSVVAEYRQLTRLVRNLESMDRVLFMTSVDVNADTSGEAEEARGNAFTLTLTGVAVIAEPIPDPEADEPRAEGSDDTGGSNGDGGDTEQASG